MAVIIKERKLTPLLKYPGGKEKELRYILPNIPLDAVHYYEPFVGGGAVYFALDCDHYYINDRSAELIHLYQMIGEQNPEFLRVLDIIDQRWDMVSQASQGHTRVLTGIYEEYKAESLAEKDKAKKELANKISVFTSENINTLNRILEVDPFIDKGQFIRELEKSFKNKMIRMDKLEREKGELPDGDLDLNLESAFKNAFYMYFRHLYNHIEELSIDVPFATAIYFFIREYCYSSMFRYNRDGKFNVPYGGISYNRKSILKKAEYFRDSMLVSQLNHTTIGNRDFMDFVHQYIPGNQDFIFLDPPYDTEFSTYAQNEFTQNDQARLANYLIGECRARFMLVIKNTDYILSLYPNGVPVASGGKLYVNCFDKKYFVSFQDRNDKDAEHLMITNYPLLKRNVMPKRRKKKAKAKG